MNELIKNQVTQEIEQYKLEVQNKELQTQIGFAKDIIASQNQHTTDMYNGMNFLIYFPAIVVAILGFAIPYLMSKKSNEIKNEYEKMKNDYEQKIKDVDDFITNKFKEWENQNIDDALERYLKGELDIIAFNIILKGKPMSYKHMKKIFDFAKEKGDVSPDKFFEPVGDAEPLGELIYYLFEERKDNKSDDFEKMRKLIIDCEYFYTLALIKESRSIHSYGKILKTLSENEQQEKILDIIEKTDNSNLYSVVLTLIKEELLSHEIEKAIAEKIIKTKDFNALIRISNNEKIIDILEKENLFNGEISHPTSSSENEHNMIVHWGTNIFNVIKHTYLGKKILEYKEINEQKVED